ncbi:MAG: hypothetical protein ABSE89_02080 [Sedimentisphaerales bacterium]
MKKILLSSLLVYLVVVSGCYSCKTWQKLQGRRPADPNVKFMWEKGCRPEPMPLCEKCPPTDRRPLLASSPSPQRIPCPVTPVPVTPTPVTPPPVTPSSAPPPSVTLNTAERIYPCGGCGIVKLQKIMPSAVQTGAEFEYKIKVTNLTSFTITDVVVTDILGTNSQYKSSNPSATIRGNTLVWVFPSLQAGETKEIVGIGIAPAGGVVQECTNVTYAMPLCMQTVSVLPVIAVKTTAPAEISICDMINYIIKVENTGTGPATNVKIIDKLPSGLLTPEGSAKVEIPLGDIPAGTSKDVTVYAKAYKTGSYTNYAVAVADGNINVSSPAVTTVVKQPVLNLVQEGPETQYLDRELTYEIDLTNTGDMPALNTVIENQIPMRLTFVKASHGGVLVGDKVIWKVSKLNPGATAKMSITCKPTRIGIVANIVKASAACADTAGSVFQTRVSGIGAVLLEVGDLNDPVMIGSDTTYRIAVTNQGSEDATGVSVEAMLEPQMQYVSSSGTSQGLFSNGTVKFAPLPSLAPGAKAVWEVTVKAVAEGDVRFGTRLTSDQLSREVRETESTHFYK